eukprot:3519554-Pleurochrysis_carterae.AAC.4
MACRMPAAIAAARKKALAASETRGHALVAALAAAVGAARSWLVRGGESATAAATGAVRSSPAPGGELLSWVASGAGEAAFCERDASE